MPNQSKTAKDAARHGLYRTSIELPLKTWGDLQTALERRAVRMKQATGAEVNPSFTAWLRAKAEETIKSFQ